jgi:RimJ/RimL family protein N-acetyltransferase
LFGVELRKSGELIGLCGLLQRDYLNVRDIGYAIEESFQGFQILILNIVIVVHSPQERTGQGLASEAVQFFLSHRLRTDELEVAATVKKGNVRSRSLLENNGFVHQGPACPAAGVVELYLKTINNKLS